VLEQAHKQSVCPLKQRSSRQAQDLAEAWPVLPFNRPKRYPSPAPLHRYLVWPAGRNRSGLGSGQIARIEKPAANLQECRGTGGLRVAAGVGLGAHDRVARDWESVKEPVAVALAGGAARTGVPATRRWSMTPEIGLEPSVDVNLCGPLPRSPPRWPVVPV